MLDKETREFLFLIAEGLFFYGVLLVVSWLGSKGLI